VAADPSVTVQVLSLTVPRAVLSLPFTLLSFGDPADPGVACYGGTGGQVVVTKHAAQVRALTAAFAALAQAALSPDSSADLIRQLSP
jgi:hypothetical protein